GDRVMTEYYLQFADHYFRILNDNRLRYEEARMRDRNLLPEGDNNEQVIDNRSSMDNRQNADNSRQPMDNRFDNRRTPAYNNNAENRIRRPRRAIGDNRMAGDDRNNGDNGYSDNGYSDNGYNANTNNNEYNNPVRARRIVENNDRYDMRADFNDREENRMVETAMPVQPQPSLPVEATDQEVAAPPVRRRGRRPKAVVEAEARKAAEAAQRYAEGGIQENNIEAVAAPSTDTMAEAPVRRRGRRPKAVIEAEARLEADRLPPAINPIETADQEEEKPRRRGRRPKAETESVTVEA
ncbi:MAG: DUF4167 domain-containing protein, partial [Zymomonas mobilis]